eukprot:g28037.t1
MASRASPTLSSTGLVLSAQPVKALYTATDSLSLWAKQRKGTANRLWSMAAFAAAFTRPLRRSTSRLFSKKSVEQMTAELTQFVAAVASGPLDRVRRARLLGRIERILKESLGSDAEILGYGSCFTDTAETDADIDATIYVPMTLKRAQAAAKVTKSRSEMLREVALKCRQLGMEVEENISHGTVTIGEAVSVHVASNTFRSYSTCRCVLSCQRLLPLFSAYVQLDPRLRSLILALKYWARAAGVLKKQDGYIPSYVISLMALTSVQLISFDLLG